MTNKSTGPLFVCKDDLGDLFLSDVSPTDLDLNKAVVLDDVTLWDAYMTACQIKQEVAQRVRDNLRRPSRSEVTSRELPMPTHDELGALACLHVKERLRSRRKINFSALAGVLETSIERVWGLAETIVGPVPPEMVETLHSKGWISNVGDGCYTLTHSGEKQLEIAEAAAGGTPGG
jgi:hypothetical protein